MHLHLEKKLLRYPSKECDFVFFSYLGLFMKFYDLDINLELKYYPRR